MIYETNSKTNNIIKEVKEFVINHIDDKDAVKKYKMSFTKKDNKLIFNKLEELK